MAELFRNIYLPIPLRTSIALQLLPLSAQLVSAPESRATKPGDVASKVFQPLFIANGAMAHAPGING